MIIDILSFSCPLLLCSCGALFSDFAGILAIFLEGLVSFSAFLMYHYTLTTGSAIAGFLLTIITATIIVTLFSYIIEKTGSNAFIAATAINLLFSACPSLFSSIIYGTRGVLYDGAFVFEPQSTKIITITISLIIIISGIIFLKYTRFGLYLRITGSDSKVLLAKGVNPFYCKISAWGIAAFFAAAAGVFLSLRISSFVPNISSGRGWMALAAVYLGKKKPWRIILSVVIFCATDYFAANIQNYIPQLPSAVLLALPYIICIILITFNIPVHHSNQK